MASDWLENELDFNKISLWHFNLFDSKKQNELNYIYLIII